MLNVQKLVVDSFEVNSQNGWHKEGRTFEEIGALIGSEVAEALEDHRNGHAPTEEWYTRKAPNLPGGFETWNCWNGEKQPSPEWKPEGIPSELADIVIRIGDAAGLYGWGGSLEMQIERLRKHVYLPISRHTAMQEDSVGTAIGKFYIQVGSAIAESLEENKIWYLAQLWFNVEKFAGIHGVMLERAVKEKLAHNRTRGYKHGGKVI